MQEIENHIADLSGSIHFQANTNVLGSNCPTISSSYQLRLNITQADPERSSSILNLPSYSRTPELFGGSSANILASPLHEWNFTVRRRRSRPSIFKINEPSTFQSDTEPWEFSSTESFLPMEPCATLIADVTADKKRLRKSLDLMQFLTPESQTISIEFTVMSTPCLILEVRWMPFTRLDLAALEKFPVSQFLSMDWYSSFEESSQGSNGALMIRDRRVRGLSPPPESERDWDGGFESMNLRDIMTSNDKLGLPHVKEQWQVQSNEATRDVPSPLIDECTTETSLFQYQQNIFGENENYPEENESSGDKEGDMTCHDEEDLSYLINTAQQRIKNINRYPNRYREILEELSVVIKTLHEQLTTSRKFSTTSLSKRKLSPRKMDSDLRKSLSELDLAIGESPSNFTSAVESWTTPLSTGWDDLDSAIEWHLQNVSLLLEKLACSERIFIGTSDSEGSKNNILLSIREDLIAMALDSQSEILSDITGLIFSYSESKEPLTVVLQSHCLAYCGMMDRGYQNSQSGTHSPLFPTSFWTNFVWQNAPTSNLLLNSASTNRLSTSRENIHPSIMIDRESLQAYLLKEYVIPSSNEDEQALHIAIDTLIEQITDNDLTDASPSREIPLTQLCHRLKPQNFKVLTHFVNLKPGTFNTRARVLIPRPTQSTAPSIGLALQYLIQQG
nr:hypothetical transcript [Hymenolepis microstoma]